MRIAICDDDSNITSGLKKDICAFFKDLKIHVDFSIFSDGSELIKEIKNKDFNFDIIFMDIDMPETSGFDAARIIREIDEDTIIIFVSSYEEYVFESLEYNPFRYIRKSRINEELTPKSYYVKGGFCHLIHCSWRLICGESVDGYKERRSIL